MKTVEELKEYIEHREEILKKYGTSRWYDQSKRDIEQLKAELRLRELQTPDGRAHVIESSGNGSSRGGE